MSAELQQPNAAPEAPATTQQPVEQPGADTQAAAQPEATADAKPQEGEEGGDKKVRRHVNAIQNRIDELTRNWREEQRARTAADQELASLRQQLASAKATGSEPRLEQFKTYDEYLEAKAAWKAEQIVAAKLEDFRKTNLQTFEERAQQDRAAHAAQQFDRALQAVDTDGKAKFKDFDEVIAAGPRLGPNVGALVMATDKAAEISYYFAKNPEVGLAVASMPREMQAMEIGKLAAQFSAKRVTSASPPPKTVGQSEKSSSGLSDELPADEWYKRRQAQHRRG